MLSLLHFHSRTKEKTSSGRVSQITRLYRLWIEVIIHFTISNRQVLRMKIKSLYWWSRWLFWECRPWNLKRRPCFRQESKKGISNYNTAYKIEKWWSKHHLLWNLLHSSEERPLLQRIRSLLSWWYFNIKSQLLTPCLSPVRARAQPNNLRCTLWILMVTSCSILCKRVTKSFSQAIIRRAALLPEIQVSSAPHFFWMAAL